MVIAFFTFLVGTSSCIDDIFLEGNGILQTEKRRASDFDEITSSGDFNVTVMPGSKYSVEVTAESNLLSYIETDVVGKTLRIRTRGLYSFRRNDPIEVYITTPELYTFQEAVGFIISIILSFIQVFPVLAKWLIKTNGILKAK